MTHDIVPPKGKQYPFKGGKKQFIQWYQDNIRVAEPILYDGLLMLSAIIGFCLHTGALGYSKSNTFAIWREGIIL